MDAPVSNSIPFLTIARHFGIEYGTVLSWTDWLTFAGNPHICAFAEVHMTFWQRRAEATIDRHPQSFQIYSDIAETVLRLARANQQPVS